MQKKPFEDEDDYYDEESQRSSHCEKICKDGDVPAGKSKGKK